MPDSLPATAPHYLGHPDAGVILYLPRPPQLPSTLSVPALIDLNGNHWRKILTILAKLCAPGDDWRAYRDRGLLQRREAICFEPRLRPRPARHLVAGKANWSRLGLAPAGFEALDAQQRLWRRGELYLTPYFDYRQFPNALVARLRADLG